MSKPEIQKIAVYLSLTLNDTNLVAAGARLAGIFKKELKFIHVVIGSAPPVNAEEKFREYSENVERLSPGLKVSATILKNPGRQLSRILSDELEIIILVAGAGKFRELSEPLRSSPVPFLFINENEKFSCDFRKIIIPVDMRKQNKDSLIWSAFFGRNNKSEIIAIGASDRSKESRKEVAAHLKSLKSLLVKSDVEHKIYKGTRGSMSVQWEALETAGRLGADMIILLGSTYITWLDRLLGLPEEKMIRKAGSLPVLIVNPRRETYLVCD
jgi:nucleotide-binding universal stress UspA family protein